MFPHTNKKMMLEGWCFPVFSKVEPNYNPKPLGFMFFLPHGAETNTNRYKFPLRQQMASRKKKHGVLWEIMIRQTNVEGFPNTTMV
jgi:hypothetical protein